jgi:hypothetical protein
MALSFNDVNSGETLKEFATEHVIEALAKFEVNLEDYVESDTAISFILEMMRLAFIEGHITGMNDGKDTVLEALATRAKEMESAEQEKEEAK